MGQCGKFGAVASNYWGANCNWCKWSLTSWVSLPALGFSGRSPNHSALRRKTSKPPMEKNTISNKQRTFLSNDGLVEIRTTTCPRRWPPHSFPVVIVTLRPRKGTRVLASSDTGIEWMPRYSEVLSLLLQMGLTVSTAPVDKPEQRRLHFAKINARRHARRSCR